MRSVPFLFGLGPACSCRVRNHRFLFPLRGTLCSRVLNRSGLFLEGVRSGISVP